MVLVKFDVMRTVEWVLGAYLGRRALRGRSFTGSFRRIEIKFAGSFLHYSDFACYLYL